MIVYGDPVITARSQDLLTVLRAELFAVSAVKGKREDALRVLLVRCGQLEQAVHDYVEGTSRAPASAPMALLQSTTEAIAALLLAERDEQEAEPPLAVRLRDLASGLEQVQLPTGTELAVKVPEGFAFYTLFPEQYAEAARQWHLAQPAQVKSPVLVIGVRSAGTTLSAVVAAELSRLGWRVRRVTVRPGGHPFEREVALPAGVTVGMDRALVVDEGPGLSGSSMAAVAAALEREGIRPERIAFLPGHGGDPGSAASAAVRARWKRTPRYQVPLEALRWREGDLRHVLSRATEELLPGGGPVLRVDDLSWGQWRAHAIPETLDRPAAALLFERTKYRCHLRDGRAVLWKFEGFAEAPSVQARLTQLARHAWTPAPLGARCGFVATPWIEGAACTRKDLSADLLRHLGRYVAAAAGPPLSAEARRAAAKRLRELLYWNTWEALGAELADRAGFWADRCREYLRDEPSYGDGRLASWEWIRAGNGRVIKVDAGGHSGDHTAVGPQSVLWDLAGTVTEWELSGSEQATLFEAFRLGGGGEVDLPRFAFYQAGYAASRMGLMHLCRSSAPDESERARAEAAYERYRRLLASLLSSHTVSR